ncbi:MAG: hypothetical protein V4511_09785 [Bacteroidota bacterium]
MELGEVKDSAKEWLDNRLKNPYFASVIAVWLYTNRVVVFGIFNFDENQTLEQRVSWVQQQLERSEAFGFIHGFHWIILYSFFWGLVTMLAFKYLKVFGQEIYRAWGKWATEYQATHNRAEWYSRKEVEELEEKYNLERELSEKNKIDMIKRGNENGADLLRIKQENEIALKSISELKSKNETLSKENVKFLLDSKALDKLSQENSINTGEKRELTKTNVELKAINKGLEDENKKSEQIIKALREDNEELQATSKVLGNEKDDSKSKISELPEAQKRFRDAIKFSFEEKAFNRFIESEESKYFPSIVDSIIKYTPIKEDITAETIGVYIKLNLIEYKGDLVALTDKGEQYFIDYIKKSKKLREKKSGVRGVSGGVR